MPRMDFSQGVLNDVLTGLPTQLNSRIDELLLHKLAAQISLGGKSTSPRLKNPLTPTFSQVIPREQ